jgi:hypothetical protein
MSVGAPFGAVLPLPYGLHHSALPSVRNDLDRSGRYYRYLQTIVCSTHRPGRGSKRWSMSGEPFCVAAARQNSLYDSNKCLFFQLLHDKLSIAGITLPIFCEHGRLPFIIIPTCYPSDIASIEILQERLTICGLIAG